MGRKIEKTFNTGNKLLRLVEYADEKPDIQVESQDDCWGESFEIDSKQQLKEIIEHLQAMMLERWPEGD